jgi:hypothetical protein
MLILDSSIVLLHVLNMYLNQSVDVGGCGIIYGCLSIDSRSLLTEKNFKKYAYLFYNKCSVYTVAVFSQKKKFLHPFF